MLVVQAQLVLRGFEVHLHGELLLLLLRLGAQKLLLVRELQIQTLNGVPRLLLEHIQVGFFLFCDRLAVHRAQVQMHVLVLVQILVLICLVIHIFVTTKIRTL